MGTFIERNISFINNKLDNRKCNLLSFGLVFLVLVVIFSYGVANVSAASGSTIYVNGSSGNDIWDGQYSTHQASTNHGPKKSIKNATGTVNVDGTVNIANGQYSGAKNIDITVDRSMTINGQGKSTILNGTGTNLIFIIGNGINVTLKNLKLTNGNYADGGAIFNIGTLTVSNTILSNNNGQLGGAIYNGGTMSIISSTFTNNNAISPNTHGGAVYNAGIMSITSSTFNSNNATWYGGALYNHQIGTMAIKGSSFSSNYAFYGGAINNDGSLVVSSSSFINNNALNGGAIDQENNGTLTVTGSTFKGNAANGNGGGAIYNGKYPGSANPLVKISNSNFTSNKANNDGGAIYNDFGGKLSVTGSIFTTNHSNIGGAIINGHTASMMIIKDTAFNKNSAKLGGAIYSSAGTISEPVTIFSSTFNENSASSEGGAVIYDNAIANMNFNRIFGNSAPKGSALSASFATINAANNWWGDNKGPNGKISGLTITRWLVLTINSSQSSIPNNGYTRITTDLIHDNTGALQTVHYVPDGISVHFSTSLGNIGSLPWSTSYGISQAYLHAGTVPGTADVIAKLDNQTVQTSVKILDTIPPKVSLTSPKNGATGVSKTATIIIKFSEKVKSSTYLNSITVKNLTTGKIIAISKSITGNTLSIKTATKTANTTYLVTIPKAAVKDMAGNNLAATYTVKFKTGA